MPTPPLVSRQNHFIDAPKYRVPLGVASDFAQVGPNLYAVTFEDRLVCLEIIPQN